jgi:hypothetical protein
MKHSTALKIEFSSYLWVIPIVILSATNFWAISIILFIIFLIHLCIGLYVSSRCEKNAERHTK